MHIVPDLSGFFLSLSVSLSPSSESAGPCGRPQPSAMCAVHGTLPGTGPGGRKEILAETWGPQSSAPHHGHEHLGHLGGRHPMGSPFPHGLRNRGPSDPSSSFSGKGSPWSQRAWSGPGESVCCPCKETLAPGLGGRKDAAHPSSFYSSPRAAPGAEAEGALAAVNG